MDDGDLDAEVIAESTENLLENNSFIYKGMENLNKVSNMNVCLALRHLPNLSTGSG
jgi:hypothetical protein